jgi:hypothetical protein
MKRIRQFEPADILGVCALRRRVFRTTIHAEPGALEEHYRELFFGKPFSEAEFPSFVAEDSSGMLVGFIGVIPKPMICGGKELKLALATELMVDPSARGFTGIELMRRHLSGPQDLTYSDVTNAASRLISERLGGEVATLYCLDWHLPLQSWRHATIELMSGPVARQLRRLMYPVWRAADTLSRRTLFQNEKQAQIPEYREEPLSGARISALLPLICTDRPLFPLYSEDAANWALTQLTAKKHYGLLRARLILDEHGQAIGWYIYFANRGGTSQVVQIAARRRHLRVILSALIRDATNEGAVALAGRVDPPAIGELSALGCTFRHAPAFVLIHTMHPEVLATFRKGDAFLTRMEGEWCMNA